MVPTELRSLVFAGTSFSGLVGFRTDGETEFDGDGDDGVIGFSLLQYYDVYYDYPDSRVILVPNAAYRGLSIPSEQ